ncbi:MAG: response regulator [Pseudomonadota bacterium]
MATASVLIVDDNEVDRYILRRLLDETSYDFKIFEEADGSTALKFLADYDVNKAKYPDLFPPLVIFLDINMPIMTGPEFLNEFGKLRRQIYANSCVVMMFTSSDRQDDIDEMLRFDFVGDYLVKGSFDADELARRIDSITSGT